VTERKRKRGKVVKIKEARSEQIQEVIIIEFAAGILRIEQLLKVRSCVVASMRSDRF
jgi:hypothetical protein